VLAIHTRDVSAHAGDPPSNELAAFVGPLWSEIKTCGALDASPDILAARREAGALLELVTSDGDRVYPVFQFVAGEDGRIETRTGLAAMLQELRSFDPWTVAVLLKTPAPELDGSTPVEWERAGGAVEALRDLAAVVAREWAAGGQPR
jgi:hypothetical protein